MFYVVALTQLLTAFNEGVAETPLQFLTLITEGARHFAHKHIH